MKYYILLLFAVLSACTGKQSDQVPSTDEQVIDETKFVAKPAPEWSNLFLRKSGWFGGDGIFAIPFSGKDSAENDSLLFLFSDTMIGEINGEKLRPGYVMVNNSVAVLKGKQPESKNIVFKMAEEKGIYKSIFTPVMDKPDKDTYYWLGDGFVNNDSNKDLFVFAYKTTNTHDKSDFPFKETGNDLIRIPAGSQFPYTNQKHYSLPFNKYNTGQETISFGAGVFDNSQAAGEQEADGFVYIYGIKGINKKLVAARIKPASITAFNQWQFWDGKGWNSAVSSAAALSDSVSNEMSVSRLDNGKYALVYQLGGIFPDICMQVGPSPVGPFGPRITLYKTSDDIQDPDLFTYNAKAHPALSKKGELLISYNVNSFKFFQVIEHKPNLYRPRFILVKFSTKPQSTNLGQ